MQQIPKKENAPNFSNPAVQQSFIEDTHDTKTLMQKELSVNQEEQNLLMKRIELMKQFVNDLPSADPQYSMILIQVQMDQLELDELKVRQTILSQHLSSES